MSGFTDFLETVLGLFALGIFFYCGLATVAFLDWSRRGGRMVEYKHTASRPTSQETQG